MLTGARRQLTKLGHRSADESQVALLLKDFDDADQMLEKIRYCGGSTNFHYDCIEANDSSLQQLIASTRAWRDAWRDILAFQERLVTQFHGLYTPISASTPDHIPRHEPVDTPYENIQRVAKLQDAYVELRNDLTEEVDQVEDRIVKPAIDARTSIQPLKKVIKKRQDRKLDYERFQKKFDSANAKQVKTDKDRVAVARCESDLAIALKEYETADEKIRFHLPPIIGAAFKLLPHLLSTQVVVQNSLLANYYTTLHTYCQEEGFPSPPPEMTEILAVWENDFKPLQSQVETGFALIANGKAVRLPFGQSERPGNSVTGLNIRNGIKGRVGSQQSVQSLQSQPSRRGTSPAPSELSLRSERSDPPSPNVAAKPPVNFGSKPSPSPEPEYNTRIASSPYQGSLGLATPNYSDSGSSGGALTPHYPAAPRADYFSRERNPSQTLAAAAAGKKKPPPPPPKRKPSNQSMWVTALYDFAGQGQGDLSFREGDKIKVTKKTPSRDDWWEGELKGMVGPFPANYCQASS